TRDESESPSALLPPPDTVAGDGGEPSPSSDVAADAYAEGGEGLGRRELEGLGEDEEKLSLHADGQAVSSATAATTTAAAAIGTVAGDNFSARDNDRGDSASVVVEGGVKDGTIIFSSDGRASVLADVDYSTNDNIRKAGGGGGAAVGSAVG
ncbi:unnamed protein product, partial [Laminaria digitata]